jgi:hypothetical protein
MMQHSSENHDPSTSSEPEEEKAISVPLDDFMLGWTVFVCLAAALYLMHKQIF